MQLKIKISLAVALVLATITSVSTGLTPVNIGQYFLIYSCVAIGAMLLFSSLFAEGISFGTSKSRRPTRSKFNELGSGDMAGKEQIKRWLKPDDDLDTVIAVRDLKGSESLLRNDGKFYIKNEERNRHLLFIAKTGSGKTTKAILPILYSDCMSKTRSTIVIDSKPEMWAKLADMTHQLNPEKKILLFNPLDTLRSLSWNIVGKVEDDTDAKLIANTLIMATDNPSSKSDSPFFRNNALALLNAMMVGLLDDPNERLSIPRLHELLHAGKENLCDWLEVHPSAIRNARTFVELARGGSQNADTILSELAMRLAAWDLKAIRSTTFAEELDLETLITHPTLFVLEFRESEMEMLRPMANVVVIEILRFLTKRAESCPGHRLPRPVGLVIDEFASALGRLPDIHVKLNTLRSRNVSIVAAIQSIAQIRANYDRDADSVISGFSTKILMPALDFQDSEWASKETGTMTVRFKTQTTGTNRRLVDAFAHRSQGSNEQVQQRAVLTPDEIGRPINNASTFFIPATPVFQGHLVPYYEDPTMKKHIGLGDGNFKVREEPIKYEEKLASVEELTRLQAEAKAAAQAAQGTAIGAIQPNTKVVHTNTPQISPAELQAKLDTLKNQLEWNETTGVAREWWEAFEAQNSGKLSLVVALCEELIERKASITEFFLAYLYSGEDNIEGNLAYLDKMKRDAAETQAAEESHSSVANQIPPQSAPTPTISTAEIVSTAVAPVEPKPVFEKVPDPVVAPIDLSVFFTPPAESDDESEQDDQSNGIVSANETIHPTDVSLAPASDSIAEPVIVDVFDTPKQTLDQTTNGNGSHTTSTSNSHLLKTALEVGREVAERGGAPAVEKFVNLMKEQGLSDSEIKNLSEQLLSLTESETSQSA